MIKPLPLLFLVFVNFANASELINLNYYPHAGQIEINPHFTTTIHNHSDDTSGVSHTIFSNQYYLGIIYGVAERIRLGVADTLLWDQVSDGVTAAGAPIHSSSDGLSNPTFSLAWRFLENSQSGFSGDLSGTATPSLGTKFTAEGSLNRTGNNLSGFASTSLRLALYWRKAINELELATQLTQEFGGRSDGPTPAANVTTDPVWTQTASLSDRVRLGQNQFIQLMATAGFTNTQHSVTDTGRQVDFTTPFYVDPRIDYGFCPDQDIVLQLGISSHKSTSTNQPQLAPAVNINSTVVTGIFTFLHVF